MNSRMNRVGRKIPGAGAAGVPDAHFLAEMAVGLWRLQNALRRELDGSGDPETTRSWRYLRRLLAALEERGITMAEKKPGDDYDPGMSLKVVHCEEVDHIRRELIQETLSPTVFMNGTLLRAGEVIVARPRSSTELSD
jgi:hypothetical protein